MELIPFGAKSFSEAISESLQVPTGMIGPAITAVVSLGIQKKYCVHPLPDWYESGSPVFDWEEGIPSSLYFC